MKKLLIILGVLLFSSVHVFAQEDDDNGGGEKIRDKMNEFIQRRLALSKAEAEKFTPVFIRYFREWRSTIRENKADRPMLQLRIAELRIRFRPEFKEIVGEARCNRIYDHQDTFMKELRQVQQDKLQRQRPLRRTRLMAD